MKKHLFLIGFIFFLSLFVFAGVDFVTIAEEGQYKSVKEFTKTYEININQHN